MTSADLNWFSRSDPGKQRHRAMVLLMFGVVRIICWIILAALIGAGLAGVDGFAWARQLAESLPFVVLISVYANLATDLDAATSAFAALVAADSHTAVVVTRDDLRADLQALQADITRLAGLQPGPEADELAESIQQKLADDPRPE
jgi:uncharacterized membrane protein